MKIDGQGLPATDLESFLPALAVNLPSGSKLTAGTLSTNLHVTGPTNKLVTDGTIGLFNGKLSGFDWGRRCQCRVIGRNQTGKDLEASRNSRATCTWLRRICCADNLNLVVPALGTVVGGGTLDSKNNMDFKLVASVNSSVVSAAAGRAAGAAGGIAGKRLVAEARVAKAADIKVPLQVKGTTANPQFGARCGRGGGGHVEVGADLAAGGAAGGGWRV